MSIGRFLISAGLLMVCAGVLFVAADMSKIPLGRLPGDLFWRKGSTTVYFPVVSCILLSVAFSFLLWLLNRH